MYRKLSYVLAFGVALSLTSCGKKLGQLNADYFTVNPNPLEVVGEKVPATVSAKIPAKYFVKNAEVTVTPYLVYNGQEVASQPYSFQGEKVRGNNPVISYEYGGTATVPVRFDYVPEMAKSELQLAFDVRQGSKQYVLPRVKVADGVIATAALADATTITPAIAPDAFQRVINEKYAADIMFLINQANIRANQLNTDAMQELQRQIREADADKSREIRDVNISSYASPDGTMEFNTRLAENREKNTKGYMTDQLRKDKIQDKDLILSVLSMYKDPEVREREIRNMSSVFEVLADEILPQLRYSRITASIDVIGKSDEEIKALYASNPSELSVEEILYCATLTDDKNKKLDIYNTAARLYPRDYRTYNNLGMMQYELGDYKAAAASFDKAASMGGSAEAKMNLGLIELVNKDYNKANQYFGSAAGVEGLGDAMGVYYLKKGDANAAVRAFGDSKSNNAALAQILTKDYSKAKTTLAGIENPDATTYYLMAVLGARTNNESMLNTNLRQAVRLDSSMAQKAVNDLEFANYNLSKALN